MNEVLELVEAYNAANRQIFQDMDDFNMITAAGKAGDADLEHFEKSVGFALPDALKEFYKTFGGLENKDNPESYCLSIPSIHELENKLQGKDWDRIHSLGLIDMIKFSWGNDREEFNEGAEFSKAQIEALNRDYKCFGWYRDDTVLESAYYLYFDQNGHFGKVFYDQDDFDDLKASLLVLQNHKAEPDTLPNILKNALIQIKATLIEWNE